MHTAAGSPEAERLIAPAEERIARAAAFYGHWFGQPVEMEGLADDAKGVIRRAVEDAQRFGHNYIGTEHVLVGLVGDATALPAAVLAERGVTLANVQELMQRRLGRGTVPVGSPMSSGAAGADGGRDGVRRGPPDGRDGGRRGAPAAGPAARGMRGRGAADREPRGGHLRRAGAGAGGARGQVTRAAGRRAEGEGGLGRGWRAGLRGGLGLDAARGARLPGEPVEACARRGLREEAGLVLDVRPTACGTADWAVYVAEAAPGAPVSLAHDPEHDRYAWLAPGPAAARCRPAQVAAALGRAVAFLQRAPARAPRG